LLREFEELSYQDIAAISQRPLGAVISRLARARSQLRSLLTTEPPHAFQQGLGPVNEQPLAACGQRGQKQSLGHPSERHKPVR
jgi:hypothetical protein